MNAEKPWRMSWWESWDIGGGKARSIEDEEEEEEL